MLGIVLNKSGGQPLKRQLYQAIKEMILEDSLKGGEVLPSTRELAKGLNLSRNTVCEAYDMLITEGYALSSQGAPTRVAEGIALVKKVPGPSNVISEPKEEIITADFQTGKPDLRLFPFYTWMQMVKQAGEEIHPEKLAYTQSQGLTELRKEISAWLYRSRGMSVEIDDLFITSGATQALHLSAELLCSDGREILIEDPCHNGMLKTFLNHGSAVVPVPADEQGIQTDLLPSAKKVAGIYVTPSHQFPLGGILTASRRAALIRFASSQGAYIIEDDYDSEFRYCGEPVAPLRSMDPDRVIYVGTFSKSVFPALRIGFAVLPKPLHTKWIRLRTYHDVQNPVLEQAALSMFLHTRKLDRHVKKMRRIYGERRKALTSILQKEFGDRVRICGDDAGLHLAAAFKGCSFDDCFRKQCLKDGVRIVPLNHHCIGESRHSDKLLIGYGHLTPEEIGKGIELLKTQINKTTQ